MSDTLKFSLLETHQMNDIKKRMMAAVMSTKGIPLNKAFRESCSSVKMFCMNGDNMTPSNNKNTAVIGKFLGKGVIILSSSIMEPLSWAFSRKLEMLLSQHMMC